MSVRLVTALIFKKEIHVMKERQDNALIWIAASLIVFTFLYFFSVTFMTVPKDNLQISSLILGYISGIVSMITGYYWGNSKKTVPSIGSKAVQETIATEEVEHDYIDGAKKVDDDE